MPPAIAFPESLSTTARLQLMVHFTLRRAIPRRATRITVHLDSVSAKLRDLLRCITGSVQTAWMMMVALKSSGADPSPSCPITQKPC
ncbi:MAG TPA: hypothetical protein VGJ51_10075, partial [Candidatus Angelobacter sp.]